MIELQHAGAQRGRAFLPRHHYRAYGMTIGSEIELPELEPAEPDVADVSIRRRAVRRPGPASPGATFAFEADRQYLEWDGVGAFLISDASTIDVDPAPGVGDRLVAFPLLGPVLALLMHQRGILVLHASAMAVGGQGTVFLGDKGAGKSTTAAAMLAAGHRLLTDDLVAVSFPHGGGPMIEPGFPQIKLTRDAAAAVAVQEAEVRPQVHPAIDKMQHRLAHGFATHPVPARRLYVLGRGGTEPTLTPLPPEQALTAVIRFSYVARFGRAVLSGADAGRHLAQCARLAERVGVFRLEVPDDLANIGRAVSLIESDLATGSSQ